MKEKICFLAMVLFLLVFAFAGASSAKDELEFYEDCMKEFSVSNIDLRSKEVAPLTYLLNDYFACRVAANDDIKECSSLLEPIECRKVLTNYWLFYGRLIQKNRVTQVVLDSCSSTEKNGCKIIADAIVKDNPSICYGTRAEPVEKSKADYCAAVYGGNPSLCPDLSCRDLTYFVAALKAGDQKLCDKISINNPNVDHKERLKMVCKGGTTGNTELCQQAKEFENFKKRYCSQTAKQRYLQEKEVLLKGPAFDEKRGQ